MCATFEVTSRRVIRGLLLRPRLQSTPFTYRFAYILGSSQQEVPLLTYEHLANSVEDVLLPAGPAPFGSVFLVVYVTDVFGAQARGAVDTDRVSPAAVNVSLPDVTVDTVINYTTAALTRLSDDGADAGSGGTQRKNAVMSLGTLSEVVIGSFFPCAHVDCGLTGRCVRGGCFCPAVSPVTGGTTYIMAAQNDSGACIASDANLLAVTVKPCPGSSAGLTHVGVPEVECSGHGVCVRSRTLCSAFDVGCVVSCNCSLGWAGNSCQLTHEQVSLTQELQQSLLNATVSVGASRVSRCTCRCNRTTSRFFCVAHAQMQFWNSTYQTSSSAAQQAAVLNSIVTMQDNGLANATAQTVLNFAVSLSAHVAVDDVTSASALVSVVGSVWGGSNLGTQELASANDAAKSALSLISTNVLDSTGINVRPIALQVLLLPMLAAT